MGMWMFIFLPLYELVMNIIYIAKSGDVDKWCVEMYVLCIYINEWWMIDELCFDEWIDNI